MSWVRIPLSTPPNRGLFVTSNPLFFVDYQWFSTRVVMVKLSGQRK
nr:MAG TPA: hypothetical protein [Caudoviricetes sp.]